MTSTSERKLRAELTAAQNGLCYWCHEPMVLITLEHLIPRAKGGETNKENCVAACKSCNGRKGSDTPRQFLTKEINRFHKLLHSRSFSDYREGKL